MSRWPVLLLVALVCLGVQAFARQATTQESGLQVKPATFLFTKDMTVYIRDFDLDAADVKVDQGTVIGQARPGILKRRSKAEQQSPSFQAQKIVGEMSNALVNDLNKAGYSARYLAPSDSNPTAGVLVEGIFTEVDEGNRLHRAIIGFGSGSANMQLYVTLRDLSAPDQPLYNTVKNGAGGKKPGAMITLNPYAAAAKFIMEKNTPEKMIKKTASDISTEIIKHFQQHEASPPAK